MKDILLKPNICRESRLHERYEERTIKAVERLESVLNECKHCSRCGITFLPQKRKNTVCLSCYHHLSPSA